MTQSVLVDSHAHLADPQFADDLNEVLRRASAAGVAAVIAVGTDVVTSRACVDLAGQSPHVWATVGIHPHDAEQATPESMRTIRDLAQHPRVVAVGETGLDYYRMHAPTVAQQRALEAHVALADDLGLPVVIHNREASDDLLMLLGQWGARRHAATGRLAGVFHCFNGDAALLAQIVGAGFAVSFAGPLTYRNADALRVAARTAPIDAMLVETDSPYLAPALSDKRTSRAKRNEPAGVVRVAEVLAAVRHEPLTATATATTAVATHLFGLSFIVPYRTQGQDTSKKRGQY